ncbi:hypothetical protein J7K41_02400 [Candidatus Micrarchaeota archaeon]|nr:hypothetical protein [Candidatus Micrarchaeota archaeon]
MTEDSNIKNYRVVLFELLGVILKVKDPLKLIRETLDECRMSYNESELYSAYRDFSLGKIDEKMFWNRIDVRDPNMPRKLILEKLEYSLDDEFVNVVPDLSGRKICVKGDIPLEWVEQIFESSGLSNLVHMYLFSYDLGKPIDHDDVYTILKEKFADNGLLFIEPDVERYLKDRNHGFDSAVLLRGATKLNGTIPEVVLTRMEDICKLLR